MLYGLKEALQMLLDEEGWRRCSPGKPYLANGVRAAVQDAGS